MIDHAQMTLYLRERETYRCILSTRLKRLKIQIHSWKYISTRRNHVRILEKSSYWNFSHFNILFVRCPASPPSKGCKCFLNYTELSTLSIFNFRPLRPELQKAIFQTRNRLSSLASFEVEQKLPMAFQLAKIPRTTSRNATHERFHEGSLVPAVPIKAPFRRRMELRAWNYVASERRGERLNRRVADSVTKGISRGRVSEQLLHRRHECLARLAYYHHFHGRPRYTNRWKQPSTWTAYQQFRRHRDNTPEKVYPVLSSKVFLSFLANCVFQFLFFFQPFHCFGWIPAI